MADPPVAFAAAWEALAGYPVSIVDQLRDIHLSEGLGTWLLRQHPVAHAVRSDRALHVFVQGLKATYLRSAAPVRKVCYDAKIQTTRHALGLHTHRVVAQGSRSIARHEVRIASLFRSCPEAFLRMIVTHELAHLRHPDHDRAFYQLCTYIEPDYHRLELQTRVYLVHLAQGGAALWD